MTTAGRERLREAAQTLCLFAARFSAGDSDVQREDLQVAIDDVRRALSGSSDPEAVGLDPLTEALGYYVRLPESFHTFNELADAIRARMTEAKPETPA